MWHMKRYLKKSKLQYYNSATLNDYIDRSKMITGTQMVLYKLRASILFWLCLNLNGCMRFLSILGEVASKVVLRILWRHTLGERETQGSRGTSHARPLCLIDSLGTQKIALVILGTWGNPHPVYVWRVHYVCCLCSARNETTIRPVFRDVPEPPLTEETRHY